MMTKLILTFLISLLILISCKSNNNQNIRSVKQEMNMRIKYLALGDSYTIGESVSERERFPVQLADSLNAAGIEVEQTTIIARTGWTTDELKSAIIDSAISDSYQLVSLLIGVNNQYRGRPVENFRDEFIDLLSTAIKFADGDTSKVFVLSIPDWSVTPFAAGRDVEKISNEIADYNSVKKEITEKMNVRYFNITDISKHAAGDKSLIAEDGLHPSGKMYSLWVKRILPHVIEMVLK
ncbi:MAG: SGNH/GDSL hydrolase family protein [Melioribacteraceae bacterium]|nr:SGNH/GDSL hydrolase family protein [Melioribacteraceae bacterium]MCF8354476.1 SGNH/GDSL hydrolase family protein [Melioribacteraceae bacterium]MCF8394086.1 SGNH/GDSL hydrolase family protein [Melioribacteraceae bacterium]